MRPSIVKFNLILICCSLTACSPVYRERSFMNGGYNSIQISKNEFKINYSLGLFTDASNVSGQDFVIMQRAANVTLENGFEYFVICTNPASHPKDKSLYIKCFNEDHPKNAVNAKNFLKYNQ